MKKIIQLSISFLLTTTAFSQETVTDYDGNVYQTVQIGNQLWMKENLRSVHYADGTAIPEVASYNDSDSLAAIYGLLYTWNAAMNNTTTPMTQGACPNGWHLPAKEEYIELENLLGGANVAGDKMKDTTPGMWTNLSTSSTNSSGFSARPGGEYDPYQFNTYRLLGEYAVLWTSTQANASKAVERFITGNEPGCSPYNWMKIMKYSLRCIKSNFTATPQPGSTPDGTSHIRHENDRLQLKAPSGEKLQNVEIFTVTGTMILARDLSGNEQQISVGGLPKGVWIARLHTSCGMFRLKFIMI